MADADDRSEPRAVAVDEAAALLLGRLRALALGDDSVAEALGVFGRWLSGLEAERRAVGTEPEGEDEGAPAVEQQADEAALPIVTRTLHVAGHRLPVEVPDDGRLPAEPEPAGAAPATPSGRQPAPEIDLAPIATRARLKADGCDWAVERRRRVAAEADHDQAIKPTDHQLAERLRQVPGCIAWMLDPFASLPDDRTLSDAAGCYRVLADAVEFAQRVRADEHMLEVHGQSAYELLAECCSALQNVLHLCGIERDLDREGAFAWLRSCTFEDQLYVGRHMRRSDPAEPERWADRVDLIAKLGTDIDDDRAATKERANLLGRVAYIAQRWDDYYGDEVRLQAGKVDDAVHRLVELGTRPSDPRIRDPLLSIADGLPEDFIPSARLAEALRFADEYAARRELESRKQDAAEQAAPTDEVLAARRLLAGGVVVMIGGVCRPRSRDALREAFGLSELRWISTRAHEPLSHFDSEVRRPEVRLVLLAIRWSSHSFSEIKTDCDRAGKPLVRLPRGYGVNQVAHEVLAQVSEALRGG